MSELELAPSAIVLRPDARPAAWADVDYSISAETAGDLLAADPENTRRAYDRQWSQFAQWCEERGRVALPATPQTLAEYVRHLMQLPIGPATIEQAVGTIRSRHRRSGYKGHPDTTETLRLLRAYKRAWADAGGRKRRATPILIDALRKMVQTCDPHTPAGIRDRALLLLGFNGMCRRSELAGLDLGDVIDSGDEGVLIRIRRSKTDQEAEGAEVSIPFGQHRETCAVRSTRAWAELLADRGIDGGRLFRSVDRHGRLSHEPMASGYRSGRLSGAAVSLAVRRRAELAGLPVPAGYSGHSLRSGAATSAYLAGAPVAEIIKHGRWSEKSPVVLGYIRAVDQWRHNPMKGIGL